MPDADGNYNVAWNSCEENLKFCARLQGYAFKYDTETLYNIIVQYVGTSGIGSNTVSHHNRSKNGRNCYIEVKVHFKTESY